MTVVKYNDKEIELDDKLEPGYRELDLLTKDDIQANNLDDTIEIKINNLDDTQIINIGEENE